MKLKLAVLASVLSIGAAQAATKVNVKLGDPTDAQPYRMQVDRTSAPAGEVTFDVTNLSKSMVHEMIVVKVKSESEKLPYDAAKGEVKEDQIKDLGEASDLDPGQHKALTLKLAAGDYRLICNQPGHYKEHMRVDFVVSN